MSLYGKHFTSMYTGSMYGAGPEVFALWGYVIAHVQSGQVELNPKHIAPILGMKESSVQRVIDLLMSPDPKSRNKNHEGRRLVRTGEYSYDVPTHGHYRDIKSNEDRRVYMRHYMANYRKDKPVKRLHNLHGLTKVNPASASASASVSVSKEGKSARKGTKRKNASECMVCGKMECENAKQCDLGAKEELARLKAKGL